LLATFGLAGTLDPPLIQAIKRGDVASVRTLLAKGMFMANSKRNFR
jgi:hypothetical protein